MPPATHTDDEVRLEFLVLRITAESCVRMNLVVAADPGRPGDDAMRTDFGAISDADIGADDGVRANAYAVMQLR